MTLNIYEIISSIDAAFSLQETTSHRKMILAKSCIDKIKGSTGPTHGFVCSVDETKILKWNKK